MCFTRRLSPMRAEFRRKRIAVKVLINLGNLDALCKWFCLLVDLCAAYHPDLF